MRRLSRSSYRKSCVLIVCCFGAVAAISSSADTKVLAQATRVDYIVDDPRPVAAAIDELTSRYGYLITYEDPPYSYSDDVKDVTAEVRCREVHTVQI